jgi:hypothetical protein
LIAIFVDLGRLRYKIPKSFFMNARQVRSDLPLRSKAKPLLAPKIIGLLQLKNQTEAIIETALFVPAADGLFRVTTYLETSRTRSQPLLMQIRWVDDYGELHAVSIGANGDDGQSGNVVTFRTKAHSAVIYSVYFDLEYENQPLPPYNVTSLVERLTAQ